MNETIIINIPTYRTAPSKFVHALIQFFGNMHKFGIKAVVNATDATYVHEGRNILLRNSVGQLKQRPDINYVLWIDSDQYWEVQDVVELLEAMQENNIKVMSGLYLTKSKPFTPVALFKAKKGKYKGNYYMMKEYPENKIIEVDAVGFGFLMIHREVMLKLWNKFGMKTFDYKWTSKGQLLGEDVLACERIRKLGYRIFLHTGVKIWHLGGDILPDYIGSGKLENDGAEGSIKADNKET